MAVIKRTATKQKTLKLPEVGLKQLIQPKLLLLLLVLSVGYYVYTNWQSWLDSLDQKPIAAFALVGTPQYTNNQDIRDQMLKMGELKGFFGQNVDAIREQIEAMPWIKGALVRKIWPDRVTVIVNEYQPVAYWNGDQFLDGEGVIFKLPFEKLKNANMPRLFGPDFQSADVLAAWDKIFKELKEKNLNLKSLSIDSRGAWEITLDNDIILKLGRGDWKSKIDRFVTIFPQIEIPENQRIHSVDLRYKVGAAVSFTQ